MSLKILIFHNLMTTKQHNMNQLPDVITVNDPLSDQVAIIDENGNIIPHVYSYNKHTQEAVLYVMDENGRVKTEWEDPLNRSLLNGGIRKLVMETKILVGSKLIFKSELNGR